MSEVAGKFIKFKGMGVPVYVRPETVTVIDQEDFCGEMITVVWAGMTKTFLHENIEDVIQAINDFIDEK